MIGKKCAFRGVLELTFSDGSKKRYGTDLKNWKAGIAGPVKHAGIFDGEEYDARDPKRTPNSLAISCLRMERKFICVLISHLLLSKHTFGRM